MVLGVPLMVLEVPSVVLGVPLMVLEVPSVVLGVPLMVLEVPSVVLGVSLMPLAIPPPDCYMHGGEKTIDSNIHAHIHTHTHTHTHIHTHTYTHIHIYAYTYTCIHIHTHTHIHIHIQTHKPSTDVLSSLPNTHTLVSLRGFRGEAFGATAKSQLGRSWCGGTSDGTGDWFFTRLTVVGLCSESG